MDVNLCQSICDRRTQRAQEQRIALCKSERSIKQIRVFVHHNYHSRDDDGHDVWCSVFCCKIQVKTFVHLVCVTVCVCVCVFVCVCACLHACMHVCAACISCFNMYCSRIRIYTRLTRALFFINSYCSGAFNNNNNNNNNNIHLLRAHQCPECSHNTYTY